MRAIWNGHVVAESKETVAVEGNHYFPRESLRAEFFVESPEHTTCFWKGTASYFDIEVNGRTNPGAAWYYPAPLEAASHIKDHVAFWRGVEISD